MIKNLYYVLLLAFISVIPLEAIAATGDILYQNCVGSSCSGERSKTGFTRTVETSGCYTGKCLKLVATPNKDKYGSGSTSIAADINNKKELTVVYYVKFNKDAHDIADANIKGIRPYYGGSGDYIYATMDAHGSGFYQSTHENFFMDVEPVVWEVRTKYYPQYCQNTSGSTYQCPTRVKFKFTVDGMRGFGTTWREVRHYIKMPTSASSADGKWKMWIDGTLILSAYDVDRKDAGGDYFNKVTFYPSSEAKESFVHWVDDMTIYEGYVPPSGSGGGGGPGDGEVSVPQGFEMIAN